MRASILRRTAGFLMVAAFSQAGHAAGGADTADVFTWSALYRSRIAISRLSEPFPWNDEAAASGLNDRLALLGRYRAGERLEAFAKGATGLRMADADGRTQFLLEQGHLGFAFLDGAVEGRLFSREKIFRTENRLLEVLSNDAPFVSGRGEGLLLDVETGSHVRVSYLESILRSGHEVALSGGLPLFRGGADAYRLLHFNFQDRARWHVGWTLSQTRSIGSGDAVMVGADCGLRVRGIALLAELARTSSGSWSALRHRSLFDLRFDEVSVDRVSLLFSENDAFAAEVEGIGVRSPAIGSWGLVPGYRFCGARFINPEGEIEAGRSETYATASWRHPQYDATVSVEAADGNSPRTGAYRWIIGSCRLRYRGGFELREGIMCRTGARSAALISILDENGLARMLMTVRVDDLGGSSDLSFFAEGGMNVAASVTVKGALYLHRSERSYYHVELEFRPRERFLLRAAIGSFSPAYEDMMLNHSLDFGSPIKERMALLFARVWFGSI